MLFQQNGKIEVIIRKQEDAGQTLPEQEGNGETPPEDGGNGGSYWGSLSKSKKQRILKTNATQIIAVGFAAIILLGAALLTLPAASRNGISCGFFSALFTATSATCVTGLVLFDTYTQWSPFGQTVIITLIEIGGLGFMSAASTFVFLLRRKVGLRQRMVIAQALNLNDMDGVVRIQKLVITGSLGIQGIGALILFLRFLPEFGFRRALAWGVFHSISAFCNAGFDLFGYIDPGQSLIVFNNDPVVCLTLITLVTIGGLGFLVWEELARVRSFKKFSGPAHTMSVVRLPTHDQRRSRPHAVPEPSAYRVQQHAQHAPRLPETPSPPRRHSSE